MYLFLRAQVDREEIHANQALTHHVVKNRSSIWLSSTRKRQAQNAICNQVLHEGSLNFAHAEDLILHGESTHLKLKNPLLPLKKTPFTVHLCIAFDNIYSV